MEELLQVHLPHLANGESLFPQFDSYRLREHDHAGYRKVLAQIRAAKRGILEGTKFDRFVSYKVANLHYLVAEEKIIETHELPLGWGLLVRREERLKLVVKPVRQAIGIEEQLVFLQRIAAKKSSPGLKNDQGLPPDFGKRKIIPAARANPAPARHPASIG